MSEEVIRIEARSDTFMLSELLAVIGRQGMDAGRKRRQQGDHGIRHDLCGFEWNMGDQGVAGCAFVECHERLLLACADDQIALPVAKARTLGHDGRTLVDRNPVGYGATSFSASIALLAEFLAAQVAV